MKINQDLSNKGYQQQQKIWIHTSWCDDHHQVFGTQNPTEPLILLQNFHLERRTFWWRPGLCLGMGGCKIFATEAPQLHGGGEPESHGETKIGISSRWFNVTFLSPSWRSLNLQKGHLTIPKRSQWIATIILLSKKKKANFFQVSRHAWTSGGGGCLKFRGCSPDWNLKKNDPGTLVLERFQKNIRFF